MQKCVKEALLFLFIILTALCSNESAGSSINSAYSVNACPSLDNFQAIPSVQRKPLVFVHVFKTGGSTVRQILRVLSSRCKFSMVVLVGCRNSSSTSLLSTLRDRDAIVPCTVKEKTNDAMHASPRKKPANDRLSVSELLSFNIVAGHVPYRVFTHSTLMHMTWIRDPLHMLISSVTFGLVKSSKQSLSDAVESGISSSSPSSSRTSDAAHVCQSHRNAHAPHMTLADAFGPYGALHVCDVIRRAVAKVTDPSTSRHTTVTTTMRPPVYSQFAKYFLSSSERNGNDNGTTSDEMMAMAVRNVRSFHFIGVIERQRSSMHMLRCFLDPHSSLGESFWAETAQTRRNPSVGLSQTVNGTRAHPQPLLSRREFLSSITSEALAEALAVYFPEEMLIIMRALRFENEVYASGLATHRALCQRMMSTGCAPLQCD